MRHNFRPVEDLAPVHVSGGVAEQTVELPLLARRGADGANAPTTAEVPTWATPSHPEIGEPRPTCGDKPIHMQGGGKHHRPAIAFLTAAAATEVIGGNTVAAPEVPAPQPQPYSERPTRRHKGQHRRPISNARVAVTAGVAAAGVMAFGAIAAYPEAPRSISNEVKSVLENDVTSPSITITRTPGTKKASPHPTNPTKNVAMPAYDTCTPPNHAAIARTKTQLLAAAKQPGTVGIETPAQGTSRRQRLAKKLGLTIFSAASATKKITPTSSAAQDRQTVNGFLAKYSMEVGPVPNLKDGKFDALPAAQQATPATKQSWREVLGGLSTLPREFVALSGVRYVALGKPAPAVEKENIAAATVPDNPFGERTITFGIKENNLSSTWGHEITHNIDVSPGNCGSLEAARTNPDFTKLTPRGGVFDFEAYVKGRRDHAAAARTASLTTHYAKLDAQMILGYTRGYAKVKGPVEDSADTLGYVVGEGGLTKSMLRVNNGNTPLTAKMAYKLGGIGTAPNGSSLVRFFAAEIATHKPLEPVTE